jgi:phosphatidylserine/phosphatidylglycerophosphate/cardiolipin synthase-like enzyme
MHTKFFLVNDNGCQRVWTGSHNLTNRSLRENFEVLLMIEDPAIYQDYLEYFEKIKELAD